ncbi:MAG: lipoate--protein ligase [Pseudoflavonifractor sp.]
MLYLNSPSTDPCFNLALEQHLFDTLGQQEEILMLWQNDNTVVVGRHQNTAAEVNADYVRSHGVNVVRRLSGGGAVYHDLGNLNFTFIVGAGDGAGLDLHLFCLPLQKTLAGLGVRAEITGRNDVTVEEKKFSGNAQYRKGDRVMHHGTIMFDCDLDAVSAALQVSADKIASKGVASVRSHVTNLRPYLGDAVTLEDFKAAFVREIFGGAAPETYAITPADLEAVKALREQRYAAWDWNYGASPKYSVHRQRRVEGVGQIDLYLDVEDGAIADLEVYGDFFGEGSSAELVAALRGCKLQEEDLEHALRSVDMDRCFHNLRPWQLARILAP